MHGVIKEWHLSSWNLKWPQIQERCQILDNKRFVHKLIHIIKKWNVMYFQLHSIKYSKTTKMSEFVLKKSGASCATTFEWSLLNLDLDTEKVHYNEFKSGYLTLICTNYRWISRFKSNWNLSHLKVLLDVLAN